MPFLYLSSTLILYHFVHTLCTVTGKWMDSDTHVLDAPDGFKVFAPIPYFACTIVTAIKAGTLISQRATSQTSNWRWQKRCPFQRISVPCFPGKQVST